MIRSWINSNTGDFIIERLDGTLILNLISRYEDGRYLFFETKTITELEFNKLQGFVPVKYKKIRNMDRVGQKSLNRYAPTISNGIKGESKRYKCKTIAENRDYLLKKLGV
jgi:hypothetical protein